MISSYLWKYSKCFRLLFEWYLAPHTDLQTPDKGKSEILQKVVRFYFFLIKIKRPLFHLIVASNVYFNITLLQCGHLCNKLDAPFSLMTLRGQKIGYHCDEHTAESFLWAKTTSWLKQLKLIQAQEFPHKIYVFIQQGNISIQNISQKTMRLGVLS